MRYCAACLVVTATLAAGCSDAERQRQKAAITPAYDTATGKLKELTYDSNQNGRIDMWTDMDGPRPLRTRIDRNEDGRLDRWEYYNAAGHIEKVGFSRKDDGRPDAWAFSAADGKIERVEISSIADEKKIDRWERYDHAGLTGAAEDSNGDAVVDKWETYRAGALESAAFDENGDGRPDRRLTYSAGALVLLETEPDAAGAFVKRVSVR